MCQMFWPPFQRAPASSQSQAGPTAGREKRQPAGPGTWPWEVSGQQRQRHRERRGHQALSPLMCPACGQPFLDIPSPHASQGHMTTSFSRGSKQRST